ncbi:MazG-like family protein [Streptomyces yaizuensis]|uniref:MazG-like family protein n=1 Tax=Streptomyces yaizuensis TaxID=2989713 RepID=A0ABQ5NVE1_9ACTN|nr:MazG-like family protein [Streptomyces sp. YSPA8]GLF93966.1 MazG-like family protein [Streptomyces sp. YSPA8]
MDQHSTIDPIWDTVDRIHTWLDDHSTRPREEEILLRVLKLSEEVGEVAGAVVGATGQNPRKGHTHEWTDVEAELCDVILTAMVALRSLTPAAAHVLEDRVGVVAERAALV